MEALVSLLAVLVAVFNSFAATGDSQDILVVAELALANLDPLLFLEFKHEVRSGNLNQDETVVELFLFESDHSTYEGLERLTRGTYA